MQRSSPASWLGDRRLWLLGGVSLAAIALGFWLVPDQAAIVFCVEGGVWLVLAAFAIFAHALWRTFRAELKGWRWAAVGLGFRRVVALGGVVLLVHETFGSKIVNGRDHAARTSMSMHLDKTVLVPVRGNDIQGTFAILDGMMDKRPLFFPFLVSLLHDVTGYRPRKYLHPEWRADLRVSRAGVCLGAPARRPDGRLAGRRALRRFAAARAQRHRRRLRIAQSRNDPCDLLLGARFVEKRDEPALTAFCFAALLLAQVRYESVIIFCPSHCWCCGCGGGRESDSQLAGHRRTTADAALSAAAPHF